MNFFTTKDGGAGGVSGDGEAGKSILRIDLSRERRELGRAAGELLKQATDEPLHRHPAFADFWI